MITHHALSAIHDEVVRQQVDAAAEVRLIHAYVQAFNLAHNSSHAEPDASDIFDIARIIEPELAGRYRETPVILPNGNSGIPHDSVPRAMETIISLLPGIEDRDIEPWIKSFLEIHPYRDGNGRVAWIIWIWLTAQWSYPQPLPDFGWSGDA